MADGLWLRLWVSSVRSRKIQKLSDATFRWWINLLCLSKSGNGILPPIEEIAWELRTTEEKAVKAIEVLIEKNLIERVSNGLQMHDWAEWQYESDVSTARVKRYRERHRNVSGTFQKRPQRTETETETETEGSRLTRHLDDLRDEFWNAYPEARRSKPGLIDHWYAANVGQCMNPGKLHAEIMAGLERAKRSASWAKEGGKYVCSALAFLEGERWREAWLGAVPEETQIERCMRLIQEREAEEARQGAQA